MMNRGGRRQLRLVVLDALGTGWLEDCWSVLSPPIGFLRGAVHNELTLFEDYQRESERMTSKYKRLDH
jgi:hypothetical protein